MQPSRDLGHLTAVMAYRESDGLGFDIRKRAHMALSIEQRECRGGRRGRGRCKRRVVVDDQNALAHGATWNRVPNEALSPIRPKRGVKIAAVVSTLRPSYCSRFRVSLAVGCGDCVPAPL